MKKSTGTFFCNYSSLFFLGWGWRRREGEPSRDNIPCNSLADAVNLPCTRSHSNARKLDAVSVDQCFYTVFGGEERRGER